MGGLRRRSRGRGRRRGEGVAQLCGEGGMCWAWRGRSRDWIILIWSAAASRRGVFFSMALRSVRPLPPVHPIISSIHPWGCPPRSLPPASSPLPTRFSAQSNSIVLQIPRAKPTRHVPALPRCVPIVFVVAQPSLMQTVGKCHHDRPRCTHGDQAGPRRC